MTAFAAWRDGVARVNRAPLVLLCTWLTTLAITLPLALVMRGMVAQHLGDSLAADTAASGVNYEWMQEFADQASGVGVTLKPTIIGFGAVLDNLSAFLDNTPRPIAIVGAAAIYIGLWIFMAGGIIDRYARDRATGPHGFFAASGVYFVRFLRLAVVQLVVYGVLFQYFHDYLFADLFPRITRDMTVERDAFFVRVAFYLLFGVVLATFNLIFDYAKVRAVVEDRRSVFGALGASIRFIRRNGAATGLYLLNVGLFVVGVAAYGLLAPGAGGSGLTMWAAFALGQMYVVARLWLKLLFWASETALFQGRLAHAGYVTLPQPTWPDSPAADAI